MENPVVGGCLSLFAGNLLGWSIDNLMSALTIRANLTAQLPLNSSTKRVLDNGISILLHVGLLGLGAQLVTNALPWLTDDTAAFTLWVVGLSMHMTNLKDNVISLNEVLTLSREPPSDVAGVSE